jgi:hypothetical protein
MSGFCASQRSGNRRTNDLDAEEWQTLGSHDHLYTTIYNRLAADDALVSRLAIILAIGFSRTVALSTSLPLQNSPW